jgi:signal peptidase I
MSEPSEAQKVAAKTAKAAAVKQEDSWLELAKTIVYALLIAIVIRTFLFQPFVIPSGSMKATLLVGDYVFVEKFAYGYSRYSFPWGLAPLSGRVFGSMPKRGDVVVFKDPPNPSEDFIKRVIGLPGDHIQMHDGVIYLNGQPVPKQRVQDWFGYADCDPNDTEEEGCPPGVTEKYNPQYRETLPNGKSYLVLDTKTTCEFEGRDTDVQIGRRECAYATPSAPSSQMTSGCVSQVLNGRDEYIVPPGHYFMMGDNRDNSNDSRCDVGYVPAENLVGRAIFRFFSTDGSIFEVWKWRFDRMFTGID